MLSMGDFGHINNIFLMKTTPFNAGEGYITALIKSNTFVKTNAYIWHHDVAPNRSNVIPTLFPLFCQDNVYSARLMRCRQMHTIISV